MKEMWMEILGKKLDKVIRQYKYPPLTEDVITDQICAQWRNILSGLPDDDESLKPLLIRRLLKSTIEEIEERDQHLAFSLFLKHGGELYLVQLLLKDLTWSIQSIQYVDQVRKNYLAWGVSLGLAFFLLVGGGWLIFKGDDDHAQEPLMQDEEAPSSIEWNDHLFQLHLEEITASAKAHGYVLMREEDWQREIEKEVEARLAEEAKQVSPSPSAQREETKEVTITIKPGASSAEVAKLLAEKRLVRSEKEARQLFSALKAEHKIRAGTYTISTEATYLDIIKLITR